MTLARFFQKADLSKVVYDRTARGLIARRNLITKTLGLSYQRELRAIVYVHGSEVLFVTATTLIAESGAPFSLSLSSPDEHIGNAIQDKLLECCTVPFEDVKDRKPAEWPCYVVSGAKSIRQFEENAIRLSIETINSVIRLEAKHVKTLENLFVAASHPITVSSEELGASVKNVIEVVRELRVSGAI